MFWIRTDLKGLRWFSCLLILVAVHCSLFTSCTAESNISRDYRCYFVFDTSLHPLPCQLTGIIGHAGHFCTVETRLAGGVRHLYTTRNYDKATEDIILRTEKEHQVTLALGANNSIIIGTSSYDNRLVAYDGQCPNCLKTYGGYHYPLSWQNNGQQLSCAKCQRTYDVNNGVIVSGATGRQLAAYQASFDGTLLRAWN